MGKMQKYLAEGLGTFTLVGVGSFAIISSKMLSSWTAIAPRRQPVQPKYLL